MKIEVLDLSGVGSGWTIYSYASSEKKEMEKEGIFFSFKEGKEFIDFVEEVSAVDMMEYEEFENVDEAMHYLTDLNYYVKIYR